MISRLPGTQPATCRRCGRHDETASRQICEMSEVDAVSEIAQRIQLANGSSV